MEKYDWVWNESHGCGWKPTVCDSDGAVIILYMDVTKINCRRAVQDRKHWTTDGNLSSIIFTGRKPERRKMVPRWFSGSIFFFGGGGNYKANFILLNTMSIIIQLALRQHFIVLVHANVYFGKTHRRPLKKMRQRKDALSSWSPRFHRVHVKQTNIKRLHEKTRQFPVSQ